MAEIVYRTLELQTRKADPESRTVPAVLSTETPVERGEYLEVLSHRDGHVDLSRAERGLPLIESHDAGRVNIGKVENVRLEDGRMIGDVRFGKSNRGRELFDDVAEGIVDGVSIGYIVREWDISDDRKTYTARNWMPFETSAVSVPADPNAGFFRSIEGVEDGAEALPVEEEQRSDVAETPEASSEPEGGESRDLETSDEEVETMTDETIQTREEPRPEVDVKAVESKAVESERNRISDITRMGEKFGKQDMARNFIESGKSVGAFRDAVLEQMEGISLKTPGPDEIGLSEKEKRQFSFLRMLRAQMPNADRRTVEAAAFEREVCEAAAKRYGREPKGWLVPDDIMYVGQRDLEAGSATKGDDIVDTNLMSGSFIDQLRNEVVTERAGATVMTGLTGDVAIPRQTGGPTAYWVAESGTVTESDPTFDQVTLSPETVGSVTEISRKLLLQSSIDVENFVRREQASRIGIEIDRVTIEGSGTSNQPEGILNTTGIGAYSATSAVGESVTWDMIVQLWKEVAKDNAAVGRLGWLASSPVIAELLQAKKDTGSGRFVMESLTDGLLGFPVYQSNNVPTDLQSAGDKAALIFGNFADLLIGYWSGVDVLVDPYSNSKTGTVRIVTMVDCDVDVRHAESFAATKEITLS